MIISRSIIEPSLKQQASNSVANRSPKRSLKALNYYSSPFQPLNRRCKQNYLLKYPAYKNKISAIHLHRLHLYQLQLKGFHEIPKKCWQIKIFQLKTLKQVYRNFQFSWIRSMPTAINLIARYLDLEQIAKVRQYISKLQVSVASHKEFRANLNGFRVSLKLVLSNFLHTMLHYAAFYAIFYAWQSFDHTNQ